MRPNDTMNVDLPKTDLSWPLRSQMLIYPNRIRPVDNQLGMSQTRFNALLVERDNQSGSELHMTASVSAPATTNLAAMALQWLYEKGSLSQIMPYLDLETAGALRRALDAYLADSEVRP